MRMEIVNEEGTKKEIDMVFMLREKKTTYGGEFGPRETEMFYTYTDTDEAVEAFAELLGLEASEKSRMDDYFQYYAKPRYDFIFEDMASREDVERLESALFKQHIGKVMKRWDGKSGRAEGEPDIIAMWDKQQENEDWSNGYESCQEFIEVLKAYDISMDENAVTDMARRVLGKIISETDWLTRTSYRSAIRTLRHTQEEYHTMQLIVLRGICTTVRDWKEQVESVRYHRYCNSEKGKAEIEAEKERHHDMMTYMGESGLHSYSVDSNGTYTMWRGV